MNRRQFIKTITVSIASFLSLLSATAKSTLRITEPSRIDTQRIGKELITSSSPDFAKLDSFLKPLNSNDTMSRLFDIFKASIQEINNDKVYFLNRLKQQNEIAEALSDYLSELNDVANKNEKCTPHTAVNTTYAIDQKLYRVIKQIKVLPVRERSKPDIQAVLMELQKHQKIVLKARSIYLSLM